jgi:hypothetical protein
VAVPLSLAADGWERMATRNDRRDNNRGQCQGVCLCGGRLIVLTVSDKQADGGDVVTRIWCLVPLDNEEHCNTVVVP